MTRNEIQAYMVLQAAKRDRVLAYGVGNDMSGPYYTYQNSDTINFRADGINGPLEQLKFSIDPKQTSIIEGGNREDKICQN